MLHHTSKADNGCPMYGINVRLDANAEASDDNEEFNRNLMCDFVARSTEGNKQAFIVESR
jgi:hypothetical protein